MAVHETMFRDDSRIPTAYGKVADEASLSGSGAEPLDDIEKAHQTPIRDALPQVPEMAAIGSRIRRWMLPRGASGNDDQMIMTRESLKTSGHAMAAKLRVIRHAL
jgi:hypothetical protein